MPAQDTGALVIIFDTGNSVSQPHSDDGTTFFEHSRKCISWILRRKILSLSKDLICLLATGTEEDEEYVDNETGVHMCRSMCVKYEFQTASWEMLNYIDKIVKTTNRESDWFGTLAVAVQKLEVINEFAKITNNQIVIFSDLKYSFLDGIESVIDRIKNMNIDVTVIGLGSLQDNNSSNDEPAAKKICRDQISELKSQNVVNGDKLVYALWSLIGDLMTICSFDSALRQLSLYSKKKVRAVPWNCVMDVGDLKISVQVFKKVDRKSHFRANLKCLKSNDLEPSNAEFSQCSLSDVTRDKVMYYTRRVPQKKITEIEEVSVDDHEVVEGHRYGTNIIPFSDEDKSVLGYRPGKKCLTVLGFTNVDNVPYYAFVGEGSYIVVPRDKDEYAEVALSAIIQAMVETKSVAIVRRVYSDDRGMSLGVLYPVVQDLGDSNRKECLILIELGFREDFKPVRLPRLGRIKKGISDEHFDLIDKLIDGMDLMKVQSEGTGEFLEALDLSSRHEIKNQFLSHCIAHRALYPDNKLPKNPQENDLFYIPQPLSSDKLKALEATLCKLFMIKTKSDETTTSNKHLQKEKTDLNDASVRHLVCSEEKTAEACFKKLFKLYKYPPAEDIRNLLLWCVNELKFGKGDVVKAFLHFTREARQTTIQRYTDDYNYWMRRLRVTLGVEGELEREYWSGVAKGNLGLITMKEHSESITDMDEADLFTNSLRSKEKMAGEEKKDTAQEEAVNLLF